MELERKRIRIFVLDVEAGWWRVRDIEGYSKVLGADESRLPRQRINSSPPDLNLKEAGKELIVRYGP